MLIEVQPPDVIETVSGEILHPVAAFTSHRVLDNNPKLLKLFAKHDFTSGLSPDNLPESAIHLVLVWKEGKLVQFRRQNYGLYSIEPEICFEIVPVILRLFRAQALVNKHLELVANE